MNFFNISIIFILAIVLGFIIALTHKATSKTNRNFLETITILPLLVSAVILVVNGNLGMGVAVAGAFGLVRFRSAQGTSKEIATLFFVMAVGLSLGAGYAILSVVITFIGCLTLLLISSLSIFDRSSKEKILRISIPESLDYDNVFEEVLKKYTKSYSLEQVKTTNLGSLFELKYYVTLKNDISEKEFIDELRVRNGNLKINLSHEINSFEL